MIQQIAKQIKLQGTPLDKRRKVSPDMSRRIKDMYEVGYTQIEIAKQFNLHPVTIRRELNPDLKKRDREQSNEILKTKYRSFTADQKKVYSEANKKTMQYKIKLMQVKLNELLGA